MGRETLLDFGAHGDLRVVFECGQSTDQERSVFVRSDVAGGLTAEGYTIARWTAFDEEPDQVVDSILGELGTSAGILP